MGEKTQPIKKNRLYLVFLCLYLILLIASFFVSSMSYSAADIPPELACIKNPGAFPGCKKDLAASFILTCFLLVFLILSVLLCRKKLKIKEYLVLLIVFILVFVFSLGLFSLDVTPQKTYNSRIQADLAQIRDAAEVYLDDNGTYIGFTVPTYLSPPTCSGDAYIIQIEPTKGDKYLAYAKLCPPKENAFWCVDYSGQSKEILMDSIPTNIYICP
jgi:hypothetical protein